MNGLLSPAIRGLAMAAAVASITAAVPRRADAQIAEGVSAMKLAATTKGAAEARGQRLDETVELACHNCYDRKLLTRFADALKRTGTRSVEIDVFDDYRRHRGARPGAWYVRHKGRGNDNNCGTTRADGDLRTCLEVVRSWVMQTRPAGPILVFLDKKQGWDDARSPRHLDSLILQVVPREHIYAPGDLLSSGPHATLRDAAYAGGWRTVDSLQAMVMFVLTGPNVRLHRYVQERGDGAVAFVAPDVKHELEVDELPRRFDATTAPSVVFYNYRSTRRRTYAIAKRARDLRRMTRVWFPLELRASEGQNTCKLMTAGANRIARYKLFDLPADGCIRRRPPKGSAADPKQQA
ncbi:MAG TPA: Ca2+-dependent phosphoinositide-specific phospholipase C [Longimicrobiaceae bacterium]|nr:Ca2+-dependent phosphoinositide-specific phospholipase C [Longimicrobiaceae bacterium]